jgi:hypothetical protein
MTPDELRVCITSGKNLTGRATLCHALRGANLRAVCGTKPGRTVGWEPVTAAVTCPRCIQRLAAPGSSPLQRGPRRRPEPGVRP